MPNSPLQIIELNNRTSRAYAVYGEQIAAQIPHGTPLPDPEEKKTFLLHPKTKDARDKKGNKIDYYDLVYKKFVEDACSNQSIAIMLYLYQHEFYFKPRKVIFLSEYKRLFTPDEFRAVEFYFPDLCQTTLSRILNPISPSTIASRLAILDHISLVQRSPLGPPNRKNTSITQLGINVMARSAHQIEAHLGPYFHTTSSPPCSDDGEAPLYRSGRA